MEAITMKRKGISPLIGAVLLIAFTMAVAAILTAWVTTFTQDTAEAVGNNSERLIECSYSGLSIYDAVEGNGTVTVSVANTGTIDLSEGSTIVVFLQNGSVVDKISASLPTGSVEEVTLDDGRISDGTVDRVRATSVDCPEVSDETSDLG